MISASKYHNFLNDRSGNIALIMGIGIIPIVLSAGFAVDYTMASRTRSKMQEALDAEIFAALNAGTNATQADRENRLAESYVANGGLGAAKIDKMTMEAERIRIDASAYGELPTTFMKVAAIDVVPISVNNAAVKTAKMTSVKFSLDVVTGYWDKTVTLYGRERGSTKYKPLLDVKYMFNGIPLAPFPAPRKFDSRGGDTGDGIGTTTISKLETDANGNITKKTELQKETCQARRESCTKTNPAGAASETIDVTKMDDLYLEMTVSASQIDGISMLYPWIPKKVATNNPALADRLFVGGKQMPAGVAVDIFRVVPCGQTSSQAWEDGGTPNPSFSQTDFKYKVDANCGITDDPSTTYLAK